MLVIQRTLTAIVLLAIVVGALFLDPTGWAVKILIVLVAAVCEFELSKLVSSNIGPIPIPYVAIAIGFFLVRAQTFNPLWIYAVITALSVPLICLSVIKKNKFGGGLFGTAWIFGVVMPLYILASTKSPATWPLLMTAAIPIWCGDTAAIFVGKAFGKRKMAPEISPNKTWEGATGNLLACIGAAMALGAIFHYPMMLMVLLGLNCGVIGQAGDLFESWLKRKADVKDSGNILPGHGGLLDRLDSLMATAPLSLLILQSLVVPGKP